MFVAEGRKCVGELLKSSLDCVGVYTDTPEDHKDVNAALSVVTPQQMKQMSGLKTPAGLLGVFRIPESSLASRTGITLALDDVRDPGNLGTIIRLSDWFGIEQIVCSESTVDCYNQKVVQATMGSLTRVNMIYTDLENYLRSDTRPVLIADMNGESVYKSQWPEELILVMGNEANGISPEIRAQASGVISIPQFGVQQETESLNVATATAIILSEFRRNHPG
nr:TrmH family RNA methyltransferase [Robertkochia marina]